MTYESQNFFVFSVDFGGTLPHDLHPMNNETLTLEETETQAPKLLDLRVCAGKEIELADVAAAQTPEPTDRWQPIPHVRLIEHLHNAIDENPNLEIVNESHTLARYGLRYFGLFQIRGLSRRHGDDVGTVFGLRNSHDRSCRAGIMAGDAPFACTNMIFNNEIVLGRRHTTHIERDLPNLIARAVGQLCELWGKQDDRIDVYREVEIDDRVAHDLIVRGFRHGACSKTQIADIAEQWHSPEHEEFSGRTLWSLQNAFTNVYRGNLVQTPKRSEALNGLLDTFARHAMPKSEEFLPAVEVDVEEEDN